MIHELKPYPAMKDSGVPWLGEVPAGWEVRRNGRLFAERKETGFSFLPILEVSLKTGVRVRDFGLSQRKQVMADRDKYKRAASGDIAYNMMRMWQGAVGVAPTDGLVSPAYVVARPFPGTVTGYLAYLYRTSAYMGEVNNYSHGIVADRNRLYWDEFKQIPTPYPSPDEQSAIVRFLDHADGRIRRYIRAKQKLITVLEEQKQAINHRAVTRGLEPNVRLKASGVEWLGDLPQHWEVKRLRYLIHGKLTYGANAAALYTNPDWPRFLRITDFGVAGTLREDIFRSLPPEIAKDYLVQVGDVLLARSGATVGKAFLVGNDSAPACHAGYLIRARPNRAMIDPSFLFAFTQSTAFAKWKDSTFIIATIQNIGADKYADLKVPLPPLHEQCEIVDNVQEALSGVRAVMERCRREISLFREYRTRLIADVVTGKLDVREAAANLPAETEESELPLASSEVDEGPDVDLLDGDADLEE